jgi:tetratricopeptide (TPR) repeat protein
MTMADVLTGYPLLSSAAELAKNGKLEEAAQQLMRHLGAHPREPRGLALLGQVAMQLGALGQAELFLRRAIACGNRDFEVRRDLASTINQQERLAEALPSFEALEQESDDPALAAIRAIILDKLGRNSEALELREELAGKFGNRPHYEVAYGHSLRAAGRVDDAIDAYRRSVAIDDECGEGWWGLAGIKRAVLTDEDIAAMRHALGIAIDVRNSAPLHFSLARALHDRQEYEQAFDHYAEGNRQRAEALGYDRQELTREVDELERDLTSDHLAAAPYERDALVPIFIVSLPRSGSTLLEQMLGSHPDIEAIGELPYVPAILRTVMENATRAGPMTVSRLVRELPAAPARAMGEDYLRRVQAHRKTERRVIIDKLPHNWSNIPFIRRILPQALFIDIRRPAMDCCFSNFTQSFSSAHASSFALEDIGQCYVDYVRLMAHLDAIAPKLVHHIDYSRLVDDPESQLRSALDYLGLPWNEAVLRYQQLDRVVRTPSAEQVRRPLNREGMGIWLPYERWLGPLRKVLGKLAEA